LVSEHPNQWDLALPQDEFSYNESPNISTGLSPFKIVYGVNPRGVFELRDLGQMEKRSTNADIFFRYAKCCMKRLKDSYRKIVSSTSRKNI
jgi:hypothetical protein